MAYDPAKHDRRSIRLRGFDYATAGAYFVTICTQDRMTVLGEIENAQIRHSALGASVAQIWTGLPKFYAGIEIDESVVMPNHLHAIVWLTGAAQSGGLREERGQARRPAPTGLSLSDVVQRFKSYTTNQFIKSHRQPHLWQRNYYEHVVRDDDELFAIRQYINANPQRWGEDHENPAGSGRDDVEQFVRSLTVHDDDDVVRAGGRP